MKNNKHDHVATYSGNPGGKPIYPNTIDHGYGEPLAGGTDVMRRLQNQLLHEQGSDDLKRPESPRLASYRRVAEAYDCLKDYRAGGMSREEYEECLDRFKDDEDDYRSQYRRPPAPAVRVDAPKLQVLDKLLARRPDHFVQSIRDQVARGRTLSEAQLKAVRSILYRNMMKPEAENFRMASGDPISDFIVFMDANAVRFPKGPIGWWLPAHNMAIRLTRENKIIVLRYQILPDIANPFRAHQPNNPKGPTLGLSPMWWKHERLGGFYSIGMAERFLTLAAHEPTVMATVRNELQSLTDLYGNPVNVPPELVTKLSMNAAKNAIARWGALRIRNITIPL